MWHDCRYHSRSPRIPIRYRREYYSSGVIYLLLLFYSFNDKEMLDGIISYHEKFRIGKPLPSLYDGGNLCWHLFQATGTNNWPCHCRRSWKTRSIFIIYIQYICCTIPWHREIYHPPLTRFRQQPLHPSLVRGPLQRRTGLAKLAEETKRLSQRQIQYMHVIC
jgi:hypothetical protein